MSKPTNDKQKQEEDILERTAPPGEVVYHAIYREGEHELNRKTGELAFSGLAAGLSMGFSLVAEAVLQQRLPDTPWRPLIAKLGYSVGFLIVILGRQQLFTKNTLTVILPVLRDKKLSTLGTVAWLWVTVFVMNLIGAFVFAWLAARSPAFSEEARGEFLKVAQTAIHPGFAELFARGIVAGWLIALMVWLLPFAESAHIWVIIILAYLIGIAELPHIIAGSVEAFYCVFAGGLAFSHCVTHYLVPVLLGNVIGGVTLVALGVHAEFIEASDAE